MKFTTKKVIKLKETKIKLKLKVNMKTMRRDNNMRAYKWSKRENKL